MSVTPAKRAGRFGDLAWRFDDLSGKKFGRLRVLSADGVDKSGHHQWICACECGARKIVNGTSLRLKRTRSCGCYMRERMKKRADAFRLTNLSFHRASKIYDALERNLGVDRLNKIFAACRGEETKEKSDKLI